MDLAKIEGDELVIRLPIDALVTATEACPAFEPIEDSAPKVTDPREWMKAVVDELNHEEEDGTTLVHLMLDEAFEKAADQGAEGIRFSDEEA